VASEGLNGSECFLSAPIGQLDLTRPTLNQVVTHLAKIVRV